MTARHASPRTFRWRHLAVSAIGGALLALSSTAVAGSLGAAPTDRVTSDAATILAAAQDLQSALATPSSSFSSNASTPSPIDSGTPTPSVTDSSTPSPSSTITPSPSGTPVGCLPLPSACGYPDATNTGVPAGTQLVAHSGSVTVNTAGTIIDGWDMTSGRININANNVTVRNTRISTGAPYAISIASGVTGVQVTDVTIIGQASGSCGAGVNGGVYTALRVNVSGCEDGFQVRDGTQILDSYIWGLKFTATSHNDGIQAFDAGGMVIRHNTILVDCGCTPIRGNSAVFLQPLSGPIGNVAIDNNLLSGAGYTVKVEQSTGVTVTGNRIGRGFRFGWLSTSATTVKPALFGNVFDDNLAPAA